MLISFEIFGRVKGSIFELYGREKEYIFEVYGREKDPYSNSTVD
jgi:hypothetical protein